jgi:hypothetical protein
MPRWFLKIVKTSLLAPSEQSGTKLGPRSGYRYFLVY